MIRAQDLAIGHGGRRLLENLSLQLARGGILAVLGPNGRGKTTLLRTLLGVHPQHAGSVQLGGHAAYVPQQAQDAFPYDVLTMVVMGRARHLRWYQGPRRADVQIAHECLHAVGLLHLAHRSFTSLSGGERQLACIARAMASDSPIMLLDEPSAALDLRNQDIVLSTLRRLARERALTVVFSTHQPQHALHIADQTLLMHADGAEHGATLAMCSDERLTRLYGLPIRRVTLPQDNGSVDGVVPIFH